MTRKIDSHFPDVCKKVLKCERVQKAIKDAAQEEFNEMQEEEAGIEPKTDILFKQFL
jgi:hypothetical protein